MYRNVPQKILRCTALRNIGGFASVSIRNNTLPSSSTFHSADSRLYYGTLFSVEKEPIRLDSSQVNEIEDAVALFNDMLVMRPRPSVVDFTKLLKIVVKMKRYTNALFMFDKMRRLDIAINCCCHLRSVNYGFSVLGIFFKLGNEPNVCTFNTLRRGLFLANKVSEAEHLFKKLLRDNNCEPNEVMLLILVDGLCKAGHMLTALEMLKLFEKTSWNLDVKFYSTVINSLCKDNMVDDALHLLSYMIENGISPDVVTYNSALKGLCNFGRWKDAKDLLTEMVALKISLDVFSFNILVDSFCKEGMVKEAEDVMSVMLQKDIRPGNVTYNALIDGYSLRGEMEKHHHVTDVIKKNKGTIP